LGVVEMGCDNCFHDSLQSNVFMGSMLCSQQL